MQFNDDTLIFLTPMHVLTHVYITFAGLKTSCGITNPRNPTTTMIYGHGDDLYRYGGRVRTNFSSNICQNADLGALKRHLAARLDVIGNYPEPAPLSLEKALAGEQGVDEDNVIVTNGATEAIYLIAQNNAMRWGADCHINIIPQPTFSEYADACRACGSRISDGTAATAGRKVVWLCNPNNPTGSVKPAVELLSEIDARPDVLFVIDQSYEHYTNEPMIADKDVAVRRNIILLHSMTKRFCIPGLRLGYAMACRETINELRRLRRPWSVNALAVDAGLFLVSSGAVVIPPLDEYLAEAQRLNRELGMIDGITVVPTKTNFMLASIEGHTAAELKEFLVARYGLLIRDASNFSGLDTSYFRVAAQDRRADDMLIEAIKDFLK